LWNFEVGPGIVEKIQSLPFCTFFILILYTSGMILYKIAVPQNQFRLQREVLTGLSAPDTGSKKNIYLLLFDEYQGDDGLSAMYGTAAMGPAQMLHDKGFYVKAASAEQLIIPFIQYRPCCMTYLDFSDGKLDYDLRRVVKSVHSLQKRTFLISS
jgi:hypothetical protein